MAHVRGHPRRLHPGDDCRPARAGGFVVGVFVNADNDAGGQHWPAPPGWRAPQSGADADRDGNLDAPQFEWLQRELRDADKRDELVIVFGHHPISSLTNDAPDENAGDCALRAITGPGCDLDPRDSRPLRRRPAGRVLVHRDGIGDRLADPVAPAGGDGQSRTLSIFGTLLDHAAALVTPRSGASAARLGPEMLAALGREFAFNDPQVRSGRRRGRGGGTSAGPQRGVAAGGSAGAVRWGAPPLMATSTVLPASETRSHHGRRS